MLDDATIERPRSDLTCALGPCKRCSCGKFGGNGNICEECGHHYDEHTTGRAPERETPSTAALAAASRRTARNK